MTETLGSEHQETQSEQGSSGKGRCRPSANVPSPLSGSKRPSHVLHSPTGGEVLLLLSFNKDKQDESLLAENWGRGETRQLEPMEL